MPHPYSSFALALGFAGLSLLPLTARAQTAPAWLSAYDVGNTSTTGSNAAVDAAGNTYEVGSFAGTFTIGGTTLTSVGNADGYLAKYAPDGTLAWVRQIGSAALDNAADVVLDAAGNVYITGFFTGSINLGNSLTLNGGTSTASKTFVVRYSPQGTPQWAQQSAFDAASSAYGNGIGVDAAGVVTVAGFGPRVITIGATSVSAPANSATTFLARFQAATGAVQSLALGVYYAPPAGSVTYQFPRLTVAPTGEMYLCTNFTHPIIAGAATLTSRGDADVLIARFSAQGTLEWTQQLGGPAIDTYTDAALDAGGNLYLTGAFMGQSTIGATTLTSAGDYDGYLVKLSPLGVPQWARTAGGTGSDGWSGVALDAGGSPHLAGNFTTGAQVGTQVLTSSGGRDAMVAAYTPQGQVRWVQQAGGPGFDTSRQLGFDAVGNLHVLGSFAATCAFVPFALTTTATSETYVATLGTALLAARAARPVALGLYPNPATDQVRLSGMAAGTRIQLFDARGALAREVELTAAPLSVRGLVPGLYTLRATDARGQQYVGRLVVE